MLKKREKKEKKTATKKNQKKKKKKKNKKKKTSNKTKPKDKREITLDTKCAEQIGMKVTRVSLTTAKLSREHGAGCRTWRP